MPDSEYGPFGSEREAWATETGAAERATWDAHPVPGAGEKRNLQLLLDGIEEIGLELGAYDLSPLRQVAMYETGQCIALRGIIRRAFELGKAAGPDGAVAEWGFRYESDDGGDIVMRYSEEEVRQILREPSDVSPEVRRTVVTRQVGPWTVAGKEEGT